MSTRSCKNPSFFWPRGTYRNAAQGAAHNVRAARRPQRAAAQLAAAVVSADDDVAVVVKQGNVLQANGHLTPEGGKDDERH